jgi:hypothetical protein
MTFWSSALGLRRRADLLRDVEADDAAAAAGPQHGLLLEQRGLIGRADRLEADRVAQRDLLPPPRQQRIRAHRRGRAAGITGWLTIRYVSFGSVVGAGAGAPALKYSRHAAPSRVSPR